MDRFYNLYKFFMIDKILFNNLSKNKLKNIDYVKVLG
jgi:hypothetical protein